ncbi:MAG: hypothetical protein JWO33_2384, partial [Caulobacteraceae bacterium]|nr:hypothetical protein [Caulobacteraceae bacterium]
MTGRQRRTPAVFVRGGTSKGVFFHERDLPVDRAARDSLFLAVLGSPDPYGRQLDGMGGGISSLSKAVIIGPPSRPDADVDYTFGQVQVDRALVDYGGTCGNLASAVGPFAYEEGLVSLDGPEAVVRIHATNTGKIIVSRFWVADGAAVVEGDFELPGVAGTGAPIKLEFLDPGGGNAGRMLPTGNVVDDLDLGEFGTIKASLVNAGNACVFVAARDVGLTGTELPNDLDADHRAKAMLEAVRAAAGVLMGYGATAQAVTEASPGNPKVAVVAEPSVAMRLDGGRSEADAMDINLRMLSMGLAHKASPLTGALCLAVAARIEGTIPHGCVAAEVQAREALRLGTPS